MALLQADVGFGGGIRTTPFSGDPISCISTFAALIGNPPELATDVWSLTWRFKPRVGANNDFATVKHTDVNGLVRRWETIVQIVGGMFQLTTKVWNGVSLATLNNQAVSAADTAAHTFGWRFSAASSQIFFDGVLVGSVPGVAPGLGAQANDYLWVQGGPAPPVPGREIDIGEIGLIGVLASNTQFLDWHTNGVG